MSTRPLRGFFAFKTLVLVACGISLGCLSKTTRIEPPPVARRTASLDQLVAEIQKFEKLRSLKATVDLQLSFLNEEQTKRRDLRDVRGFVLARRPSLSRIQAQYPVTRAKAFDMASDGEEFRVHLAWRNEFFVGDSQLQQQSDKRAENIRPQHIVEPLLIEPPREDELAALENKIENKRAYHVVALAKRPAPDRLVLTRKFWFDREDLRLSRLEIYDDEGNVVTKAAYGRWLEENGVPYPETATVSRLDEGYSLGIEFLEPGVNEQVSDASFNLEPPEGVAVERVGAGPRGEQDQRAQID